MGAAGFMYKKYFSGLLDKEGIWASKESIEESWKILHKSLSLI
jgi:hypothetical protein